MLIYLFIITIVYEIVRAVGHIVRYRRMRRSGKETPPENTEPPVSPLVITVAFSAVFALRTVALLLALAGMTAGGSAPIVCSGSLAVISGLEFLCVGPNLAKDVKWQWVLLTVYNFAMMVLFTLCVCNVCVCNGLR